MSEKPVAEMSFEEAMKALEAVVQRLESGDAPLEESITLYEQGAALKKHCEAKLRDAELKVAQITQNGDGSAGSAKPVDIE